MRGLILDFGGVLDGPESHRLVDLVSRLRQNGIYTAVLSNADDSEARWICGWGHSKVDVVIVSGDVGLRKPEPAMYRLVAERLALQPDECVFVDDSWLNVCGAVGIGMVGIHHLSVTATVEELQVLFHTITT